ncbi:hypothetical protein [Haloechinothrix salitolerans]|uniref:Toxin n=1 Tax=Haloechinothrix salitolerans TaxID=926830 RepID=A0ABW2C4Q7_9PSEU
MVEVADSARKHGVSDGDMLHALRVPLRLVRQGDDRVLYIGADAGGRLLEVVVIDPDGEQPAIIHAMPLRPKFYRFLAR